MSVFADSRTRCAWLEKYRTKCCGGFPCPAIYSQASIARSTSNGRSRKHNRSTGAVDLPEGSPSSSLVGMVISSESSQQQQPPTLSEVA